METVFEMNILFTSERGRTRDTYFPASVIGTLKGLGAVEFNEKDEPLTTDELMHCVRDKDVCLTHWHCPAFTAAVLENANRLRLIAHAGGSVGDIVTPQVYAQGIKICSANHIMAKSVAEGVLTYILAGLRQIPQYDQEMKTRQPWGRRELEARSLYGAQIGLVGFGAIARYLLELLAPFEAHVKVYDPYISQTALALCPFAQWCSSLNEVLAWGDIVSLHASLTEETQGMIDRERLRLIKDGALFVNTARGGLVDEAALIEELRHGRFRAVLDVYATEPLPLESPLRDLDGVILMPHVACAFKEQMALAMIDEIRRFSRGEPLQHEIPYEKFALMTKEDLALERPGGAR